MMGWGIHALWLLALLALSAALRADAFSSVSYAGTRNRDTSSTCRRSSHHQEDRRTTCQFAWFGGGGGADQGSSASSYSSIALGENDGGGFAAAGGNKSLGGVAGTMMAMENFKASQKIGRTVEGLVQDLAGTTVEGSSENGKVKVVYDGRQQPLEASIDPTFFKDASASTVSAAFVEAMKDAHFKSRETMNEKMKGFYNELGLSS
jgi:DNA-binding protein YbaB